MGWTKGKPKTGRARECFIAYVRRKKRISDWNKRLKRLREAGLITGRPRGWTWEEVEELERRLERMERGGTGSSEPV
jgi:hypothetical protein